MARARTAEAMTPDELFEARGQLGWSRGKLGCALRLSGNFNVWRSHVAEMENGARRISGPISVCVWSFLDGYRPPGFDEFATDPPGYEPD